MNASPLSAAHSTAQQGLTVSRATVRGPVKRRDAESALSNLALDGLGLGDGELLFLPSVSVDDRIMTGTGNFQFKRSVSRQIRKQLDIAIHNPVTADVHGRPLRFTSKARLAVWLFSTVRAQLDYAHAVLGRQPGADAPLEWARENLFSDGPSIVHCLAQMFDAETLFTWLPQVADNDVKLMLEAVKRSYMITGTVLEIDGSLITSSLWHGSALDRREQEAAQVLTGKQNDLGQRLAQHAAHHAVGDKRLTLAAAAIWCAKYPSAQRGTALKCFLAKVKSPGSGVTALRTMDRTDQQLGPLPLLGVSQGVGIAKPNLQQASDAQDGPQPTEHGYVKTANSDAQSSHPSIDLDQGAHVQAYSEAIPVDEAGPEPGFAAGSVTNFHSAYAGILYVSNILLGMGFSRQLSLSHVRSFDLSSFTLIDQLGLYWFGNAYQATPLHRFLNRTAADRTLPPAFVHPRAPEIVKSVKSLRVLDDGCGASLWHGALYPIADFPRITLAKLRQTLGQFDVVLPPSVRTIRSASRSRLPRHPNKRWIACLAKVVEAELKRRSMAYPLKLSDLAQAGSVQFADEKMTVDFVLGELAFAVRYSGIDRNPGWLVEEGRSLAFTFR